MFYFVLEILLFTNLWIYLYTNVLMFLNSNFPVAIDASDFIRLPGEFAPEPYEIPLQLIFSFLSIFLLFGYYLIKSWARIKLTHRLPHKLKIILKFLLFLALLSIFLKNLGGYPMARDSYPHPRENQSSYTLTLFIYLLTTSFIIIQSFILEKIYPFKKRLLLLVSSVVILILAVLTFEPRFPVSTLDYSLFFGPVWEISQGKTIFSQVPSLYGFLSILLLSIFEKLKIFSLWYLPALIWLLYIVSYFIFFYIIYRVSKSFTLALTALFSLLTLNYFSLFHLPASIPQIGPMRWLPLIVSLLILLQVGKLTAKKMIISIAFLFYWNIDVGISLVLSYLSTLLFFYLGSFVSLKKLIKTILLLLLNLASVFFLIQLAHFILGMKLINLSLYLLKVKQYTRTGFGMLPLEARNHFWLFILVYFASVIYFFINQLSPLGKISRKKVGVTSEVTLREADLRSEGKSLAAEKGSRVTESTFFENTILLFSANLMLFASIYYVGRSHPHNLFHISLFFVLNLFILAGILINKIKATGNKLFLLTSLFIMLVAYPAYQRQEALTSVFKEKMRLFRLGSIFIPETKQVFGNKYQQEIDLINKNFPDSKILILSDDDSYLYYLLQKKNYLNFNPQILNFAKSDLNFSLGQLLDECPKKIVADCRLFNRCQYSHPVNQTYVYVQPYIFEKLSGDCNIRYEPEQCTSHLCIGSAR